MIISATTLEYQAEQPICHESTQSATFHSITAQEHTSDKLTIAEALLDAPEFSTSTVIKIQAPNQWDHVKRWRGNIRKRFDELSIKEAIDEASEEELLELEVISDRRRMLQTPRSASDIERDIKNERALLKVVEGLAEYVRPI